MGRERRRTSASRFLGHHLAYMRMEFYNSLRIITRHLATPHSLLFSFVQVPTGTYGCVTQQVQGISHPCLKKKPKHISPRRNFLYHDAEDRLHIKHIHIFNTFIISAIKLMMHCTITNLRHPHYTLYSSLDPHNLIERHSHQRILEEARKHQQ